MFSSPALQNKLKTLPLWMISLYAAVCAFAVYFCMYAFRKPFTAAGFEGMNFLAINYKIWLVAAQLIGYMLSKFYGIRFIGAMKNEYRANTIVRLILFAWFALWMFAIVRPPYNIIFLLLNGFPLGMVWGLVFSYLEGRRATEFMGAVLCTSFIFSSGVVKTLGKMIMIDWHASDMWMPFVTGSIFVLPMILFTWLLNHMPPPTPEDIQQRSIRNPMSKEERRVFIRAFLPGIILIVATYVLLTILRDFRDNFANELFTEWGYGNNASVFTITESYISLIVLLSMSLLILVKKNIKAFMLNHFIIMIGFMEALGATLLFMNQYISPMLWMIMVGTGLYLSYVPFNALYFERMIASYRLTANVGFIMYISDAFGYLGSVLILCIKQFFGIHLSWTHFFTGMVVIISCLGMIGTFTASVYFRKKYLSISSSIPDLYAP